jgi:hypothetical protein
MMTRVMLCFCLLGSCAQSHATDAEQPVPRTVAAAPTPTHASAALPDASPVILDASSSPDAAAESSAPEEPFDPELYRKLALSSAISTALTWGLDAEYTGKGVSSRVIDESKNRYVLHAVVDAPVVPDSKKMKRYSFLVTLTVWIWHGTPLIWIRGWMRTEKLSPRPDEIARIKQLNNWPNLTH